MKFRIEAKASVTLEHNEGDKQPQLINSNVSVDVSKELDRSMYVGEDGLPTAPGVKALTQTLLHGLATNIKYAHEKGFWNDVEHIKFAVAELTRAFAEPTPPAHASEEIPVSETPQAEIPEIPEVQETPQNEPETASVEPVSEVPSQVTDTEVASAEVPSQPYIFGNHECQYSKSMNQEYPRKCVKCGTPEGATEQPEVPAPATFGDGHDCIYSRSINQEYPRKCLRCGTPEKH